MKLTKEVKIALTAVAGIVVLFFGMNFLKGLSVFSADTTYYFAFKDISGVSTSCPIYAGGYKVGTVTGIEYDFNGEKDILVEADINPALRIPAGSTASIESDMMGNVKMNLILAQGTGVFVEPGGTISGEPASGALDMVANLVPTLEQMLPKLDSIMYSLNTQLADPAIAGTLHNAETVSGNLTTATAELNTLMAALNRDMPAMMASASATLANADTLTAELNAMDIAGTMAKVDATIANVETLTAKLNSTDGTLGLLVNDTRLYDNLNATMRDADALLVNFKEHPKRYVHFSLFGKKDK